MHGARPFRTVHRDRIRNFSGTLDWYSVKNQASGPTLIHLFDEIGYFGSSAQDFVQALAQIKGDIELHINSPGGDVFDGIAIYNQFRQHNGTVAVVVDGLAASAASFIAQAASPGMLAMAPHSQMMIHDGMGMAIGGAADMRELADLLDKASDNIASIYADRTGKSASHWRALMQAETWFSDAEAVAGGLADKILGQDGQPQDSWDLSVFAHAPGMTVINADGSHVEMSGAHEHAHPAYGAQGGDDTHSHEHVHAGDASHDHAHEGGAAPEVTDAHQSGSGSADDSSWDGPAAMAGCSSASDYRAICAGEKTTGTPDERQHWALPHHKSPGGPPNRKGVSSALGYLGKTQDLKDPAAARAHLEAHQSAMGSGDSASDSSGTDIWADFDPALLRL